MTSKQKISDLPKEQKEKMIAQMAELGIKGVYTTFTVEKAKAAIEKALNEQKQNEQEQEQEQQQEQEQEQPKNKNKNKNKRKNKNKSKRKNHNQNNKNRQNL